MPQPSSYLDITAAVIITIILAVVIVSDALELLVFPHGAGQHAADASRGMLKE
jgi:hypothetical protein